MAIIKCPECGRDISDKSKKCIHCGYPITREEPDTHNSVFDSSETSNSNGKIIGIFVAVISVVALFCIVVFSKKPTNYTYSSSTNAKAASQTTTYFEVASTVLKITGVKVTSNSSYTIATGTLTNNGKNTYSFVKVKGIFQNSIGKAIDTDWTYAVDSVGLSPGESIKFQLSVPKDNSIKKCEISIYDYEVE